MKKKFFIRSFGCQMNAYDSSRMTDVLISVGYEPTKEIDDADLVIFNTCHIREKASEKMYSDLGRLRPLRQAKAAKGEKLVIAVAGCVAQAEGAEIQRRMPYVDLVFGPQAYHKLPEMLERQSNAFEPVLDTDFSAEPKFDALPQQTSSDISAFLAIQEGCDKFCTYCVVPYTRGAEYSRAPESIITEAENLVAHGAREITLLGQNVNAYHGRDKDGNEWTLAKLLNRLNDTPNLLRLRIMTSHPRDMDSALIAAHKDVPKLMPFLHLPVQSGSDTILDAMNRKHTSDYYRRLVDRLRAARPDIAMSSDFIVGFPGETDKDFDDTLRIVREIGFAQAFSFKYSRRPGTPASALKQQIPEDVKDARLQELQNLLRDQQLSFNTSLIGKTVPVLFDDNGQHEGQIFGRTPFMQPVFVSATPEMRARLNGVETDIAITDAVLNNLKGAIK